ncbi:MAG: ATP-binding protein [Cyanobacteria bacterium P01_H01_bin.74]
MHEIIAASTTSVEQKICKLMVVDDEMMVTASLKAMLSMALPHDVYCFNNPVEALTAVDGIQPDLIISDFSMPEMDGITFLKQVKAKYPEVTLILLTGYADKENAIEAINTVGLYRYIEKPWDNDNLKQSIQNGLERSALIDRLKKTVAELTVAKNTLTETNQHLEELVEARTQEFLTVHHKLQAIINHSADGIITLDSACRITALNPSACRWLHQESTSAQNKTLDMGTVDNATHLQALYIGLPIASVLQTAPDNQTTAEDAISTVLAPYLKSHKMLHVATDDAAAEPTFYEGFIGALPVEMSIAPFRDLSGASALVLVLRDMKARKALDRMRDDFISTLTHDLRTPLLAAIQTLGFFADGTLGELSTKQTELIRMLIGSNRELLGLVNVLLEVYKYESGQYKLICSPLDLSALIRQVIAELTALAESRQQTLTFQSLLPDNEVPAMVFADKQELKRVFTNIIGNAINFTPQDSNGQIVVTLKGISLSSPEKNTEKNIIQASIQDNGRGIPSQDLPKLFQRFSQGTSKQRSSGSGLGLFLSRQIIEAHNGSIWVESTENVGSSFFIQLPALAQ